MPSLAGGSRGLRLQTRYYRGYPPEAPLGYAEDTLELLPAETVFVLVDVYRHTSIRLVSRLTAPSSARPLTTSQAHAQAM